MVCRGDLFEAVRVFLEEAPHHRLADAVSRRIRRSISSADLEFVDIFLEKHGHYYHPVRVETAICGRVLRFVVNAAVSTAGRAMIAKDFNNIQKINCRLPYRLLPHVSHLGKVRSDAVRPEWILFLGQWLDGYHEFHLRRFSAYGSIAMVVWDPRRGCIRLTAEQTAAVYRRAARILTAAYDLPTSEHIGAWHHAAGDFVLSTEPAFDMKLVTVRQYRPLLSGALDDIETVFHALLLFLLSLSVRTRIDRENGTGDLLWAEEPAVAATLDGFFAGLDLQARHERIPETLPSLFRAYLKEMTGEDLTDLLAAAVDRLVTTEAEAALARRHLDRHAQAMQAAI